MTQPWASLVAIGENSIETRSWGTRHRGPLVIHAAKGFPPDPRELCSLSPYRQVLARHGYPDASSLPLGAVIAVAELVDVMKFTRTSLREVRARARAGELPMHEADFGDFSPGRYGWVLNNVRALAERIPVRGMLGLWEVPRETEKEISLQLRRA
jgi:activating signal cointegrator 1